MRLVVNYGLVIASILAVFAVLYPSIANVSSKNAGSKDWLEYVAGTIVLLIVSSGDGLVYLTRAR